MHSVRTKKPSPIHLTPDSASKTPVRSHISRTHTLTELSGSKNAAAALLKHSRTRSDVLFPVTSSFSLVSPVSPTSPKVPSTPLSVSSLQAKVSLLEAANFQLEVDLARSRNQNKELQSVIEKYEKKVAALLSRTTDCIERVIKTKNGEIARLESSLSVKEDQFAAKLEAEVQRELELTHSSRHSAGQLQQLNAQLCQEVTRLKAKADSQDSLHSLLRSELVQLCSQITHLKRVLLALKQGDLSSMLMSSAAKSPAKPTSAEEHYRELVATAKADINEIESQVAGWCGALQGNSCTVS